MGQCEKKCYFLWIPALDVAPTFAMNEPQLIFTTYILISMGKKMAETTQDDRPSVPLDGSLEDSLVPLQQATLVLQATPTAEACVSLCTAIQDLWKKLLPLAIRQASGASTIDMKIRDQLRNALTTVQDCLRSPTGPADVIETLEKCEKAILYDAEFKSCGQLLTEAAETVKESSRVSDFTLGMQICRIVRRGFDLLLSAARCYENDPRCKQKLTEDQEQFGKGIELALGEMRKFKAGDAMQQELLTKYRVHINLRLQGLKVLREKGSVEADAFINNLDANVNSAA